MGHFLDITSAREYLSSCQRSCTDNVQSKIISSRLAVDEDDKFCNNYGNKEDDGDACYVSSSPSPISISFSPIQCGNLLQDVDAQMKPLRLCIKDTCTDMSDEALTFLGVGDSDKVSAFVRQLGLECRPSVNLFDLTMFPGGSSTSDDSETTTSRSGGDESTTRVSSSSASRESSSSVSLTTSASASATDSSDSATNILMALPDTAFVATLVCGLIMAVTVYAL